MSRGKKYRQVLEKIDKNKEYSIDEALKFIVSNSPAKFDESVEAHFKLGIDATQGDQQVRGSVVLPHGTGKTKKIAVITTTQSTEAKKAGADKVSGEDLIQEIKTGKFDFDVLVATPEMMPKLASVAKILGPRGLMPNPKTGTVTNKVDEAVKSLKKGRVDFKNDKTGNLHQVIGKISFGPEKLNENFQALLRAVEKAKPKTLKAKYISGITLCSTMGPGLKIKI